jgi:hypothetical protein
LEAGNVHVAFSNISLWLASDMRQPTWGCLLTCSNSSVTIPSPRRPRTIFFHPRFTTWRYNALLVCVDSEVFGTNTPSAKPTARRLIAEALTADAPVGGKNDAAWSELKGFFD